MVEWLIHNQSCYFKKTSVKSEMLIDIFEYLCFYIMNCWIIIILEIMNN